MLPGVGWRSRTMRIVLSLALLAVPIATANAASLPGDSANGMRLFSANCTGCHDTSVLMRPDRAVQSLDALQKQIAGCAHMANKQFSQTEAQDLLKYLNDQFYHFQ
jgi:cytochrome c5